MGFRVPSPWKHFKVLQNLLSTFPKEVIYVRHFDSAKKALIRNFLDVLGIDAAFEIDANLIDCIVNRSLTNKERQVMYAVNKIHGEAYSMELSDLLIYSSPSVESEQIVCKKKTMALLQEKFNDQVEWVNKTFFNGLNIVSILSTKPIEKLQREQLKTNNSDNNVDELALDWAIKKMVVIKNEAETNILNTLQNMLVNPIVNPLLPADFDPLAYLIINKDLFFAGVNPQLHYLTYGIIEGRVYKFT